MAACRFLAKLHEFTRSKESSTSIYRDLRKIKENKLICQLVEINCSQYTKPFFLRSQIMLPMMPCGSSRYQSLYHIWSSRWIISYPVHGEHYPSKWRFIIDSECVVKISFNLRYRFIRNTKKKNLSFQTMLCKLLLDQRSFFSLNYLV